MSLKLNICDLVGCHTKLLCSGRSARLSISRVGWVWVVRLGGHKSQQIHQGSILKLVLQLDIPLKIMTYMIMSQKK